MHNCVFETNQGAELCKHMDQHDRKNKQQQQNKVGSSHSASRKIGENFSLSRQISSSSGSPAVTKKSPRKISKVEVKYPPEKQKPTEEKELTARLMKMEENKINTARFALKLKNTMSRISNLIEFDPKSPDFVWLRGKIIGTRAIKGMNANLGTVEENEVLVRWFPAGIISDEWISADVHDLVKKVALENVPKEFWIESSALLFKKAQFSKLKKSKRKCYSPVKIK